MSRLQGASPIITTLTVGNCLFTEDQACRVRAEEWKVEASPKLPASVVRRAAAAEAEATEAELTTMAELALRRNAATIAIGHGRSTAAARAAAAFARRWETCGRIVLDVVTWPEEAASWLRQATRFAAADPDLWVMAGPPGGWAQMTRRLLWSTPWQPGRTIAFAALGTDHAIALVGADDLPGLVGATASGGIWTVRDGRVEQLSCPARLGPGWSGRPGRPV